MNTFKHLTFTPRPYPLGDLMVNNSPTRISRLQAEINAEAAVAMAAPALFAALEQLVIQIERGDTPTWKAVREGISALDEATSARFDIDKLYAAVGYLLEDSARRQMLSLPLHAELMRARSCARDIPGAHSAARLARALRAAATEVSDGIDPAKLAAGDSAAQRRESVAAFITGAVDDASDGTL